MSFMHNDHNQSCVSLYKLIILFIILLFLAALVRNYQSNHHISSDVHGVSSPFPRGQFYKGGV